LLALHADEFKKCFQQFYERTQKCVTSQGDYLCTSESLSCGVFVLQPYCHYIKDRHACLWGQWVTESQFHFHSC
jgi:hypothetical protein